MRLLDLPVLILEQQRVGPVENTGSPVHERRCVVTEPSAATARLDTDNLNTAVGHEHVERADGVRPPADARNDCIGKRSGLAEHLGPRLSTDHGLELANQVRVGMRSDG